jgi:outer membrane receptor for ferrienterochelin and colicin
MFPFRRECQPMACGPNKVGALPKACRILAIGLLVLLTECGTAWADAESDVTETIVGGVVVQAKLDQGGPGLSVTGANAYTTTAADIANLAAGTNTPLSDVLIQMPGVSLDQNQQIHIRNTEGPQFQYQINGALVPFDINTNPSFVSMINPLFVKQLDLLDGILPSRYSYATGGVVDIATKDGCEQPGGSVSFFGGQRETISPSLQYGGCSGKFSYYFNGYYSQSNTAFSSATPGPNAIHNHTQQGQGFAVFSYALDDKTNLGLILSASASDNQLPNVPGLAPAFTLTGVDSFDSSAINSYLNFRDYLAMLSLKGELAPDLAYQLNYAFHSISQQFLPDNAGELIFQGVASTATNRDLDNTLQGDLTYRTRRHTLGAGFYAGAYHVSANDDSLVFPADADGNQTSSTPIAIHTATVATNVVLGVYVDDLWELSDRLKLNLGLRWDSLTGFTNHSQVDPTINFTYAVDDATITHAGFARYLQLPSFQGISPETPAAFEGTTAAGPPGVTNPLTEDDYEWDVGIVHRFSRALTVSEDTFYEITDRYLDTGQFGSVPIFAPFNYGHGYIWGVELAVKYKLGGFSTYANFTVGDNQQKGVLTGQFNFDPDELAYINNHYIVLDHQPLVGLSGGATYRWRDWAVSLDGVYSSGLRGGFADEEKLPQVVQLNAAVERSWNIRGVGKLTNRLTLLNLFDRVNLIRPAEGIGIFQSAYGPRFTVLDAITLSF